MINILISSLGKAILNPKKNISKFLINYAYKNSFLKLGNLELLTFEMLVNFEIWTFYNVIAIKKLTY